MGSESADAKQQKFREFMSILPLTVEIAGLPKAAAGSYFTEGQLEARATALKAAYKVARQIVLDVAR